MLRVEKIPDRVFPDLAEKFCSQRKSEEWFPEEVVDAEDELGETITVSALKRGRACQVWSKITKSKCQVRRSLYQKVCSLRLNGERYAEGGSN